MTSQKAAPTLPSHRQQHIIQDLGPHPERSTVPDTAAARGPQWSGREHENTIFPIGPEVLAVRGTVETTQKQGCSEAQEQIIRPLRLRETSSCFGTS